MKKIVIFGASDHIVPRCKLLHDSGSNSHSMSIEHTLTHWQRPGRQMAPQCSADRAAAGPPNVGGPPLEDGDGAGDSEQLNLSTDVGSSLETRSNVNEMKVGNDVSQGSSRSVTD